MFNLGIDAAIWGGIVAAILGFIFWLANLVRKAEKGEQQKDRADAYEEHIEDLGRANSARPPSLRDDPRNRDNKRD